MHAALLVDRAANPWAIAGQDRPQIGKLRVGAVAFDQLSAGHAARTVNRRHRDLVGYVATAPLFLIASP